MCDISPLLNPHRTAHQNQFSSPHIKQCSILTHLQRTCCCSSVYSSVSLSLPRQTPVQTAAASLETLIRFLDPLFLSPSIHISLWLSFSACFQFRGIRFDSIQLSSAPSKDVCWQDQFVLFSIASVIKPIPLLDYLSLFPSPGSHSLYHCSVCPPVCMCGNLITE